jgi:hypothetical protein
MNSNLVADVSRCDTTTDGRWDTDETANLKAHIQTLQGRLEALERTVTAMREREIKVRRGMGQLAAAYDLNK